MRMAGLSVLAMEIVFPRLPGWLTVMKADLRWFSRSAAVAAAAPSSAPGWPTME